MEAIDNNNHHNLEDIAQIKENKSEIEDKVARILKLLKNNGQDKKGKIPDDSMEKDEIIGLIHELQNEYNKLYSQYHHFKGEMGKKVRSKKEKENSSSLPDSDSEYYSSDELENGDDELDFESEKLQEADFQTPREFQTPRNLKTPRKDHKSKGSDRKREHSTLVKVQEGSETSSQIKELEGQLTVIRMDLESVHKQNSDLQVRVEEKEIEAKQLYEINLQLNSRVSELQIMLEEKGNEISDLTLKMTENEKDLNSKIETLTKTVNKESALVKALKDEAKTMLEEIAKRINSERSLAKEKEGFLVQIEDLKLEVNSLHDQKNELEETIRGKEQEAEKLCQEKDKLITKVQELESKSEEEETEASTRIIALKEQVNNLQQELDSAQRERRKWKTNSAQNLTELENEEQNKNLKEKDDLKLLKTHSLDIQKLRVAESPRTSTRVLNQHTLERKIVELAEKFQMKVENQMRLLAQRIRVAEQIQTESKESYKKILENLEQENKELNGKNATYEAEAKRIKEMLSESSGNLIMVSELDRMVNKIDEEHGKFLNRISKISNEIEFAKNLITGKNDEIKNLKENLEIFTCREDENEQNSAYQLLERKVEELEKKLRERDEILSIIGEEKREAIRQLCYQIDYHRHRYDELKQTVSKMPIRF